MKQTALILGAGQIWRCHIRTRLAAQMEGWHFCVEQFGPTVFDPQINHISWVFTYGFRTFRFSGYSGSVYNSNLGILEPLTPALNTIQAELSCYLFFLHKPKTDRTTRNGDKPLIRIKRGPLYQLQRGGRNLHPSVPDILTCTWPAHSDLTIPYLQICHPWCQLGGPNACQGVLADIIKCLLWSL